MDYDNFKYYESKCYFFISVLIQSKISQMFLNMATLKIICVLVRNCFKTDILQVIFMICHPGRKMIFYM